MMAVEKNQSDMSRLSDPNILMGEEDEDQNIRFSISISQLIEAALEREIANKPKRLIYVRPRSTKGDTSDKDSDPGSPKSSSGALDKNEQEDTSPRSSPPLGIEEEIQDIHFGDPNKVDDEGEGDPYSPPRLPIKLVMKNRYRLPQDDTSAGDATGDQNAVLDLSTKTKLPANHRHGSVSQMATSTPRPSTSQRNTVDINPAYFSQRKEKLASAASASASSDAANSKSPPNDIKMDVLDYHMLKSLSSIESPSYIAKNKNVRTTLTSAHRNYLKYSELVERIIEKKMEPTVGQSSDSEMPEGVSEASSRPSTGVKRQFTNNPSNDNVETSSDGLLSTKAARCGLHQASPRSGSPTGNV